MSAAPTPEGLADKTSGTVNANDYARLNGVDKGVISQTHEVVDRGHKNVILVGAGVSGITQAAMLLDKKILTLEDITIFDVQENFGGVWEKNKYPGCACDVPALLYTNEMMINTEYTHFFAPRDQIWDFYIRMAHRYGLHRSTQFKTFVTTCTWDEEEYIWHVETENQMTGHAERWTADIMIHAVGAFDRPKFGNTPGLESFKGPYWHTSRWNDDIDLKGKRVAIVGCGPSAGQVIPEIIDKVDHLTVYMRTPPMVFARNDYPRSKAWMWSMRHLPFFAYAVRLVSMLQPWLLATYSVTRGTWFNEYLTKRSHVFLEKQVKDPALRELLRPDFKYFCKRPLFLDNFYPALCRPNCTVVREHLTRYTENGIVSSDHQTKEAYTRDFDIIIFATGFNLAQYLQHETVIGFKGLNLQDQWRYAPAAIYGLASKNFPNFFYVNGPNANTFSSIHHEMNEVLAGYTCKMINEINKRNRGEKRFAVMPSDTFEEEWNRQLQDNIGHIVTQDPSCNSYQKTIGGSNTIIHHMHIWALWWRLRSINWKEWTVLGKTQK